MKQRRFESDDLADRTLAPFGRTVGEDDAEAFDQLRLEPGVVALGRGDRRLVKNAAVQGKPSSVRRTDLVRDRHMRVQVRVAGARVAVHEGDCEQPADVDLPGSVTAQAGEHRRVLQPADHIADRGVMRPFNLGGDCWPG